MTVEEAIEWLKGSKALWCEESENAIAHDMAIEALEKQIPRYTEHLSFEVDACAECGEIFNNKHKPKYCEHCGQALRYEDDS